jgi:RecA/RadA recombinase
MISEAERIKREMQIFQGMRGYRFIKITETQLQWPVDSKNILLIDLTFKDPTLWELEKEVEGKKKKLDWQKNPFVSPKIRDCINAMLGDFDAAKLHAFENDVVYFDEKPSEVPIVDQPKENPTQKLKDVVECDPIDKDGVVIENHKMLSWEEQQQAKIIKRNEEKRKTTEEEKPKAGQDEKDILSNEENKKLLDDYEEAHALKEQEKPPQKNNFQKLAPKEQSYYSQPEDRLETAPTPKKGEVKLLDIIYDLVEDDLVQFFGKTGTCKTSIAIQAAIEARKEGKSVYYLDTEKNISRSKREAMKKTGIIYMPYSPSSGEFRTVNDLIALYDFIKKIQRVDLLVIDSLGLPILSVFCDGNQKDQGLALQKMIIISKYLKSYANKNKSLVIVINQPESDMNKDPKTERRSFGDKSEFFYKELLKTVFVSKSPEETVVVVKTYRSRDYGQGYKLFTIGVTDDGMKVIQ